MNEFKKMVSKVIMHRNRTVTLLQSKFDGKSHEEFVAAVVAALPAEVKIAKQGSGLYNGGGSAYASGFTRSGISFKCEDDAQAPILRKHFNSLRLNA